MAQNHTPVDHLTNSHKSPHPLPVSPHSRPAESEPFGSIKNELTIHEVVEHEIKDEDVKQHVEARKDVPEIAPDLKKLGVTTNAASSFQTYKSLKLPLDEKKLPSALHAPITESMRWLGELTVYLINQSQGQIKIAHKNTIKNFLRLIGKDFGK